MFSGCSVEKYCNSHYPPQVSDSTWKEIEYVCEHDTIPIPYRAINWDTTFNFLKDVVLHRVVKDKGLTGTLDINKGKLSFKCESDSSQIYKDFYRKNITNNHIRVETKLKDCDKDHLTKIINYFRYSGIVVHIALLITFIVWLVRKFFMG